MINKRIVPCIPSTGSLGASGDLALLARLGRAMQGHDVPVMYRGAKITAKRRWQLKGLPLYSKGQGGVGLDEWHRLYGFYDRYRLFARDPYT